MNEYMYLLVKMLDFYGLAILVFFGVGWYLYQNLQRFDGLRSKSPYLLPLRMDNLP